MRGYCWARKCQAKGRLLWDTIFLLPALDLLDIGFSHIGSDFTTWCTEHRVHPRKIAGEADFNSCSCIREDIYFTAIHVNLSLQRVSQSHTGYRCQRSQMPTAQLVSFTLKSAEAWNLNSESKGHLGPGREWEITHSFWSYFYKFLPCPRENSPFKHRTSKRPFFLSYIIIFLSYIKKCTIIGRFQNINLI